MNGTGMKVTNLQSSLRAYSTRWIRDKVNNVVGKSEQREYNSSKYEIKSWFSADPLIFETWFEIAEIFPQLSSNLKRKKCLSFKSNTILFNRRKGKAL